MTMIREGLSISDAAAATGLSTHTLRYYERAGLMLSPVDRASSTHRRYSDADIAWVQFLTRLRSTGMPIATVRAYTELVRAGEDTVDERRELLLRHRIGVLAQLEEFTASLAAIDYKIAVYRQKEENA
ncbi:MAG: MerR family transcriptional regulator [Candidatus Microbacterium phytovorans]|uniref:MerR family transcriptional regulator n=1 Tax=Candidatus Microbacterium phytovorans TaxID=3121374 RepID=A0AAJ6B445_9MICO|nr:MerR family transcriptional regulator [Microbacterium sp.]WEK13987.1 MAG: MerR family transcriptional regulator [Microbacterium sp.]